MRDIRNAVQRSHARYRAAAGLRHRRQSVDELPLLGERVPTSPPSPAKDVIVLSNSDGCAIIRTAEKALGIKMGVPHFPIRDLSRRKACAPSRPTTPPTAKGAPAERGVPSWLGTSR
jgi:hypothetical protein